MDKDTLSRIISGEASEKEKEDYFDLIATNKVEEDLFLESKSLWVKSGAQKPVPDDFTKSEFESFWKKITTGKSRSLQSFRTRILRYAAVAILLLGIGGALSYYLFGSSEISSLGIQKFVAQRGSLAHVELADGTVIWLNSGSEIDYQQNDNGERVVKLKGEAFFHVKNAKHYPFAVKVGDLKIKDLGTIFNVKAYPADKEIETTLIKGQVEILKTNNQKIVGLKPGEIAQYSKADKKLTLSHVDTDLVSAWKDGKFAFRDEPLVEICSDLENWYDVKFSFQNEKLKDFRYTGVIDRTTTIGYVLKMLKITTNINYQIQEKMYEPDEIIIY